MANGGEPIPRSEFDGYVRRHEDDDDAHGRLIRRLQQEGLQLRLVYEERLSALERWQQRIIGAFALLTFLVGAGAFGVVVALLRTL